MGKRKNLDLTYQMRSEVCGNPWNKNCGKREIVVYIDYRKEKMPICRSCWREISNSKYEWG